MKQTILTLALAASVTALADINPVDTRWTLGAHEPFSMYRRMGKKSTGGIEGSAKWLKPWLDWWDVHAPERMEEFGLNALHSRFYKGMGWECEKKDFPNVKRFAESCHRHGVTALAYVQFATLYYETMKAEIPDLDGWMQVDAAGRHYMWNGYYCRATPCITCEAWQRYMEKVIALALTEGTFDGIMMDNCFSYACYCERCERLFREHVLAIPPAEREERFGYAEMSAVRQPRPGLDVSGKALVSMKDIKDPLEQEWIRWRVATMDAVVKRFAAAAHRAKPGAIVSANPHPFRVLHQARTLSLEMVSMAENLDLLMMQSDNFPAVCKDGQVRNRVRDLKIAAALGRPIVALCDGNAGQYDLDESMYLRPLVEDLVWGGIPTDRTVMSPHRSATYVDELRFASRKRMMAKFDAFAKAHRADVLAPSATPVAVLYPADALMFSVAAQDGVTTAEELCLRGHVPYGYAIARGAAAPAVPAGCTTLVVYDQPWLSDAQVAFLVDWAKRGGRLVVAGESGLWDENGSQRFVNPLREGLKGLGNVVWRERPEIVASKMGWHYEVTPPKRGVADLLADLKAVQADLGVVAEGLPETVFMEVKRTAKGLAVHLVNFDPSRRVDGAALSLPAGARVTFEEPFGDAPAKRTLANGNGRVALPAFAQYLLVSVEGL